MTDSQSEKKPLLGAVNEGDDGEEEVLEGCGGTMACNPHRPLHRYLVLAIMCFLSFGESYSINSLDPCFLLKFRNLEIFGNFNIIYYNLSRAAYLGLYINHAKNLNIKSLNHVLKDADPSFHIFIAFINWLVHGTGFI